MHLGRFDYALPRARIAQFPAPERAASRLLVAPRGRGQCRVIAFAALGELLAPGDLLVVNDTRVLPARLAARKPSGGRVEMFLERVLGDSGGGDGDDSAIALVQLRANKPIRVGQELRAAEAKWRVLDKRGAMFVVECRDGDALAKFRRHGEVPLPPYIERAPGENDFDDAARYQTVYARADGAVAAPTAGLHFDRELLARLAAAGVDFATVTLHVGAGTYQPPRAESLAAAKLHPEWVEVSAATCDAVARARAAGGRVIAVGTTVVRALESAALAGGDGDGGSAGAGDGDGDAGAGDGAGDAGRAANDTVTALLPFTGDTELFIRPGYSFRAVDALITNFHLPRSTLLVLVCAFAGYAKVMRVYREALARELRFYSYGDAMFVERDRRRERRHRQ